MMDETEQFEFPNYDVQCCVCFSVGRKLSPLGENIDVYRRITLDIQDHNLTPLEEIKLCWECNAILRRANIFEQQVRLANEMLLLGQNCFFGTQSSLTTIVLNDLHPNTIYITDLNVKGQSDTKTCDKNSDYDDEINYAFDDTGEVMEENTGAFPDTNLENTIQTSENHMLQLTSEQNKPKNNRWAKKRALQNKKPKFQIITENTKESFNRVQIDGEELKALMKSERESVYFKAKRFKCEQCVLPFSSQEIFEKHVEKFHSELTENTCDICTSSMLNKRQLSSHVSEHYYKFSCTLCEFTCYNKSQSKWHHQKRHSKVFQCLKCELKFGSRWEFFKHYKEWHEKFICDYCGISFKMRYCIKDHIRKQHLPFECKPCNKRWARYNGLWLHNKTVHSAHVAVYCVECDKQYRDPYRYRWHIANTHKSARHIKQRIPCPGCDKIFSKSAYMRAHYNLVHLKIYKYRCEQCDKNFIRNADLVHHNRRVHEGILPPKNKICYVCGRGFSTNKILINHIRTHTGEKPFACTLCSARFAQSTTLTTHVRAMHRN